VPDPSLEYQFRFIISHQLASSSITVDAFRIQIRELFLFLNLRGLYTLSNRLIDRKIFLKMKSNNLIESDFTRTDVAGVVVFVFWQFLKEVRLWRAAIHSMKQKFF
jgi:hypothetical protein